MHALVNFIFFGSGCVKKNPLIVAVIGTKLHLSAHLYTVRCFHLPTQQLNQKHYKRSTPVPTHDETNHNLTHSPHHSISATLHPMGSP